MVFTRESLPLQWAFAANNIGDVHWSLRHARRRQARLSKRRSSSTSPPSRVSQQAGYTPLITLTDKKIDLIKQTLAKQ